MLRAAFFELWLVNATNLDQILHHVVLGCLSFRRDHVSKSQAHNYCQKDARIEGHDQEHDESTQYLHEQVDKRELDSKCERLMHSYGYFVFSVRARLLKEKLAYNKFSSRTSFRFTRSRTALFCILVRR